MKVGVYNRYWSTAGGGERYAGTVAEVLSADHDVDLLGHDDLAPDFLCERLGLDLSRVSVRRLEDVGDREIEAASAEYDLFVNASFMSSAPNAARLGFYVVYFPTPFDQDLSWLQRAGVRALGPLVRSQAGRISWGTGFYPPEGGSFRRFRWTGSTAELFVHLDAGTRAMLRLGLGNPRPDGGGAAHVEIEVDGQPAAKTTVERGATTSVELEIVGRGMREGVPVVLHTDTFSPRDLLGGDDIRSLGVALTGIRLGHRLLSRLGDAVPLLATPPVSLDFLDSYDRLLAISAFTQRHIDEAWGRRSDILFPPITPQVEGTKEPIILSVGRFFDRAAGHSKKQLEMVRAFRKLIQRGLDGWEYHLVGGCGPEHAAYLERVRREADGLPVHLHIDAPGSKVRELYARASVFWHATGLGESERRHPHRMEHFGITTVEAMSAGAVPVVIGRAGQWEILEDGVHGFHFQTLDELVERSWVLLQDPDLRARLSMAAKVRAAEFGPDRFASRLNALIAETAGQ